MRRIRITYDCVTQESAEFGDFSDTGWVDEEGIPIEPEEYELEEYGDELSAVVALAVKEIGKCVEPSSSEFSPSCPPWYTETDPDIDYRTGEETRKSFHLVGFKPEELESIYRELTNSWGK